MSIQPSHLDFSIVHRLRLDQPPHAITARQGILCAATRDGIFFWNAESGQPLQTIMDLDEGAHQGVIEFDLSPDATFLCTGTADLTTKVYSVETAQRLARLSRLRPEYHNAAQQVCFSTDGRFLITAMGRTITVWSTGDWQEVHLLKGHTSQVHLLNRVGGANSGLLVSAAGKYVKLWDIESGQERLTLPAFQRMVGSIAVSADGNHLAVGGEDGLVTLWNLPTGEKLQTYAEHDEYVFGLAVSPDGSLVASSELGGLLCLWRTSDAATIARQTPGCAGLGFSPDGRLLAAASETQTVLLDALQGKCRVTLPGSTAAVFLDDHRIATGDDNEVVIRNISGIRAPLTTPSETVAAKPLQKRQPTKRKSPAKPRTAESSPPASTASHFHLYVRRELKTLRLFHAKPGRKAVRPEFTDLACSECNQVDELAALQRGVAAAVKPPPDNVQLAMTDDGILLVSATVRSVLEDVAGDDLRYFPFPDCDVSIVWPKHIVRLPDDAPLRTGSKQQTTALALTSPRCGNCGRPRSVTVRPSHGHYEPSQMIVGLSLEPGFWFVAHQRVGDALKAAKVTGWRREEFGSSETI